MIQRLLRLWRTLHWLRVSQIAGRLWFRLYQPSPNLRAAPSRRAPQAAWRFAWRPASMLAENRFVFLNQEGELLRTEDWNDSAKPKLWLYNLHYFDDLNAVDAGDRAAWHARLIGRWIDENPPGKGNGWEPYPVSLRVVNWMKWALRGNALDAAAGHSLAVQARWLCKRMEHHLLGNHLWANAKALLFAGAFFEGREADAWRREGLRLVRREMREQFLDDGGHFERSPMYHAILLEDVLDLVQLAAVFPGVFEEDDVEAWRGTAERMLEWLRAMTHPDGDIAFFNDAAFGIAARRDELRSYAALLNISAPAVADSVRHLHATGYVRAECGPAVLIMDVGEIGPDYLPGHAHADTLSFELSLHGRRVFVNGGTSTYEANAERLRQRGTAAHNTVVVDGQDSSEVWSAFRVARRARPWGADVIIGKDRGGTIRAAHDGYLRLPGQVTHRRTVSLSAGQLAVEDSLDGRYAKAEAHLHLHPAFQCRRISEFDFVLEGEGMAVRLRFEGAAGVELQDDRWSPGFGVQVPSLQLIATFDGNRLRTIAGW